jgi:hypothetical protein
MPSYEAALANSGWDLANQIFPAKIGEVIDIIWENSNTPDPQFHTHPLHVHGGHVWDIGSGNGTYDAENNARRLEGYTPIKRDTTLLYRYVSIGAANSTSGWRAWRLKVEDAGVFLMHCHSLQHMIMGKFCAASQSSNLLSSPLTCKSLSNRHAVSLDNGQCFPDHRPVPAAILLGVSGIRRFGLRERDLRSFGHPLLFVKVCTLLVEKNIVRFFVPTWMHQASLSVS